MVSRAFKARLTRCHGRDESTPVRQTSFDYCSQRRWPQALSFGFDRPSCLEWGVRPGGPFVGAAVRSFHLTLGVSRARAFTRTCTRSPPPKCCGGMVFICPPGGMWQLRAPRADLTRLARNDTFPNGKLCTRRRVNVRVNVAILKEIEPPLNSKHSPKHSPDAE